MYSREADDHTELLDGRFPRYVASGHIVFVRGNALWAVPFDQERLVLMGDPTPLIDGVRVGQFFRGGPFSVADDGTLVYTRGQVPEELHSLVWVDPDGVTEPLRGARPDRYLSVHLSPDGTRVAYDLTDESGRH